MFQTTNQMVIIFPCKFPHGNGHVFTMFLGSIPPSLWTDRHPTGPTLRRAASPRVPMATINGLKDEDPDDEDATRARSWLKKSSPSLSSETLRTLAKWGGFGVFCGSLLSHGWGSHQQNGGDLSRSNSHEQERTRHGRTRHFLTW